MKQLLLLLLLVLLLLSLSLYCSSLGPPQTLQHPTSTHQLNVVDGCAQRDVLQRKAVSGLNGCARPSRGHHIPLAHAVWC
jgi:hypothetical protein